jgi:ferric-dicitrate binding protein FerR (iron transport regulator)
VSETLRCEDARLLAQRELDHELAAADKSGLDVHLAACAGCRAELAALARTDSLLEDAFTGHPFDATLVREIVRMAQARAPRAETVAAPRPRGLLVTLRAAGLVAAAAAAVIVVGASIFSHGPLAPEAPVAPPQEIAKAYGAGIRIQHEAAPGTPDAPRAVFPDQVVLNSGGPGTLVLEDGTRVDLRPDTAVSIHPDRDGGTTVAFAASGGEVYCEVVKRKKPLHVASDGLTATVLGTKFLVRMTTKESLVAVVEGRVEVTSSTQRVVVSPDQEAFVANMASMLVVRPLADTRAKLAWNPRALGTLRPAYTAGGAGTAPVVSPAPVSAPTTQGAPQPNPNTDTSLDQPVNPNKNHK